MKSIYKIALLLMLPLLSWSQSEDCYPVENPAFTTDPACESYDFPAPYANCDFTVDCDDLVMPPMSDLLNDGNNLDGNDEVIGGITVDEMNNEESVEGVSNVQFIALGNYFNNNFDIGAMADCINLNCDYLSSIDSLQASIDAGETDFIDHFDSLLNLPEVDTMYNEDQIAWLQDSMDESILIDVMNSYNLDSLIEVFFNGVYTDDGPCGDEGQGLLNPPGEDKYTNAELDLFSQQIIGLSESQSKTASPSPSSLSNNVDAGVDLFNGNPSVNKSLYTMSANDLSASISIGYNKAGVPVNEYGGEVGTSWSLNSHAKITRAINQLPDEFKGIIEGYGKGPVENLLPCVTLSGGGAQLLIKPKKFSWSPIEPTAFYFRPVVHTQWIPIPAPIPFSIPIHFYVEIKAKINVRYKPEDIDYEENAVGYFHIDDEAYMQEEFDMSAINLNNFESEVPLAQYYSLSKVNNVRRYEQAKFISTKLQAIDGYIQGTLNLFGDKKVKQNNIDVQPDEFHFSFDGYSGKFVFTQDKKIQVIPHQELEIKETIIEDTWGNENIVRFEVYTPDGKVYTFGSLTGDGVDYSKGKTYVMPTIYTYPEKGITRKNFGKASINEASHLFEFPFLCYPLNFLYGNTYEKGFTVKNSAEYSSTWHLTSVKSLITQEEIRYDYERASIAPLHYYTSKNLKHDFPNFKPGDHNGELALETEVGNGLGLQNPFHLLSTEYQLAKASLTYSVQENILNKQRLKEIRNDRGERIEFSYGTTGNGIYNDEMLDHIRIYRNNNLYKGYDLLYELTEDEIVVECEEEASQTAPIISSPSEFKIQLGSKHEKLVLLDLPRITVVNLMALVIPLKLKIPLPVIPVRVEHFETLTELGSLSEIKGYGLELNKVREERIFKAETQRAFIKQIREIGKDGSDYDFLDFEYNGILDDLPKRFDPNQDLWGYYNDNSESRSLLPKIRYTDVSGQSVDIDSEEALKLHVGFNDPSATIGMYKGHNESIHPDRLKIGSLEKIILNTGGEIAYTYEPNEFFDHNINAFISGAGLRVKSIIRNAGDINKVTNYTYELPSNFRHIRILDHPDNWNDYSTERLISANSSAMNSQLMFKNGYVGYSKVTEDNGSTGSIIHYFNNSYDGDSLYYERKFSNDQMEDHYNDHVRRLKVSFGGWNSNDYTFDQTDVEASLNMLSPFGRIFFPAYKYGIEYKTEYKNTGDTLTQVSERKYKFVDKTTADQASWINTNVFQQQYPGTWAENFSYSQVHGFLPQNWKYFKQYLPSQIASILDFINALFEFLNQAGSIVHPHRIITENHLYSHYNYISEQVLPIETVDRIIFDDGTDNIVNNTTSYQSFDFYGKSYEKPVSSITSYAPNNTHQVSTEILYRTTANLTDYHFDSTTKKRLDNIEYNMPLLSKELLDGAELMKFNLTTLQYKPQTKQLVALYNWSQRDGNIVLVSKALDWHSSGIPRLVQSALHGTGLNVNNYNFLPEIELEFNDQQQMVSKSYQNFEQIATYNEYFELDSNTDYNGLTKSYEYDLRGRLEKSIEPKLSMEYSYSYMPNIVETKTLFTDATPMQQSISTFDGFGNILKTVRKDGTVIGDNSYDDQFRAINSLNFGAGYQQISYSNDHFGRVISNTDGSGNTITSEYKGPNGTAGIMSHTKVTDANGNTTTVYNDVFGNPIQEQSGIGANTDYLYDERLRIKEITNAIGEKFTYSYNELEQIATSTTPGKIGQARVVYNHRFKPVFSIDENKNAHFTFYDALDRIESIYLQTDFDDSSIPAVVENLDAFYTKNEQDKVLEIIYEANKTWTKEIRSKDLSVGGVFYNTIYGGFDDYGLPSTISNDYLNGSAVQQLSYNHAGMITQVQTQHNNNVHSFESISVPEYDDLLRNTKNSLTVDNVTKVISSLSYGEQDRLAVKNLGASSNGFLQQINYSYDAGGRLLSINDPGQIECLEDEEFCLKKVRIALETCNSVTSFSLEGTTVTLSNALTLPGQIESLLEALNEATTEQGHYGVFSASSPYTENGTIYQDIYVENTNMDVIDIHFPTCNLSFETIECCNGSDASDGGAGSNGPNSDLFMEVLTYNKHDISSIDYYNHCGIGKFRNDFVYDGNHRLKEANNTIFQDAGNINGYSSTYDYDDVGNLQNLSRLGFIPSSNSYDVIDELTYSYGAGSSRLDQVADNIQLANTLDHGFKNGSASYQYDDNGNLKEDLGKGIKFTYLPINLPSRIAKLDGSMTMQNMYLFTGEKYRSKMIRAGEITDRLYQGALTIKNDTLESFQFGDGRVVWDDTGSPHFQYILRDHLGNTVVTFEDKNDDGELEEYDNDTITNEVISRHQYYAFGMEMEGVWKNASEDKVTRTYNGKEHLVDLGLSDYGARYLDVSIGRWTSVDPLANQMPSWSPYNYVFNNPIRYTDPDGQYPEDFIYSVTMDKHGNYFLKVTMNATIINMSSNGSINLKSLRNQIVKNANLQLGGRYANKNYASNKSYQVNVEFDLNLKIAKNISDIESTDHVISIVDEIPIDGEGVDPFGVAEIKGNLSAIEEGKINKKIPVHEIGHLIGLVDEPLNDYNLMSYGKGMKINDKQRRFAYDGLRYRGREPLGEENSTLARVPRENYNSQTSLIDWLESMKIVYKK